MAESIFKLANELMTIDEACIEIGMGSVSGMAKAYCPFGSVFHADGGRSRAFRVYPASNSAYCFACQQYFTPVTLIAQDRDISHHEAAQWILEHKHYVPPDYESVWDALQSRSAAPEVDYEGLKEALTLSCARRFPAWPTVQFEPSVASKLTVCLELVRKVRSEEDARLWLDTTKEAMRRVVADLAEVR